MAGAEPADGKHRHHRRWRLWPWPVPLWRGRRGPLLAAGGGIAALTAAGVAVLVGIGAGAAPACAAVPAAGTEHSGRATHYQLESGGGNCSYPGPPADQLYAALSPAEYDAAAACGGYLDVTGPGGTVRVKVVDQCPECEAGHVDLSREAFARIADLSAGIVPVTYRLVPDPPLPGPLGFRVKDGASQYWFAVLVLEHGNPLASVEARAGGGWRSLERQDYNYWIAQDGLGTGPYELRVTDVAGHRVTASGIQLLPEQTQITEVWMYGGGRAPGAPEPPSSPSPAPLAEQTPASPPSPSLSPALSATTGPPAAALATSQPPRACP